MNIRLGLNRTSADRLFGSILTLAVETPSWGIFAFGSRVLSSGFSLQLVRFVTGSPGQLHERESRPTIAA
jgi:hypothetical protein